MDIILYECQSPNNYITKTLYNQIELTGSLRAESSIINPIIMIEYGNLSKYNYMYIPDFKRFYYIQNIVSIRTNLWRLECHVDVLNTYRSEILEHQAIIQKQSNNNISNMYFDDGDFIVENKQYIHIHNFPDGLDETGEYILITAGYVS